MYDFENVNKNNDNVVITNKQKRKQCNKKYLEVYSFEIINEIVNKNVNKNIDNIIPHKKKENNNDDNKMD